MCVISVNSVAARRAAAVFGVTALRFVSVDTVRNPSGPLPPRTYWRRRLVVLGALLAIVALVAWGCSLSSDAGQKNNIAGGGSSSSPSSLPTIPSETSTSPTPTGSDSSGSGTPSGSASSGSQDPSASKSSKVRKKHGKKLCPSEDLRVTVRTDERYYKKDEKPKFTLVVVNIARSKCWVDVGSAATRFNVISGSDHVWSTADCPSGKKHKLRKFKSGGVYTTSVRWNKTRSWQGCPERDATAKAGYYVLDARVDKAKPKNRAVFVLK